MRIASWADRHSRSILFSVAMLIAAGAIEAFLVPVSLFPHVNFPRVRVSVDAGDRTAERMDAEVTRPLEEALRATPGTRSIRSVSSRGSAEVWVTFDWGSDMTAALLQAQAQVNLAMPLLPRDAQFDVRRMDPTVFPVIAYSLTSTTRPLTELFDIATYQLRPALTRVRGVARIAVDGGTNTEYRIEVDPDRLAAHNLVAADVATALSTSNVLSAVGRIEDRRKLYFVLSDLRAQSVDDLLATVVQSSPAGAIVRLRDVASVRTTAAPRWNRATANGQDAILLNVYQQPNGNTVDIAHAIRDTLAEVQKTLPRDVAVVNWYDQGELVSESAKGVRDAVVIGVALAALVLLLFLRDWRITLIAALAVPAVLAITAFVLTLLGQSFNIMTLGGMAASVGLIIDDAIVMAEHLVRRNQGNRDGRSTRERTLAAADEFTRPLVGSSLSTIVIHIPPAFLIGVTGAFFAALSLSMASSLVISFVITWLAIPILAARFLHGRRYETGHDAIEPKRKRSIYRNLMSRVLRWPAMILIGCIPLLIIGYIGYQRVPSGFMPSVDEGGFIIDYVGPAGTSLTETDAMLKQVEAILRKTPEVETYSRRTGFGLGGDINEPNAGDFFVRLKPLPRRPIDEVMDDVRHEIEYSLPGLEVELAQLMEDLIGDLTGRPEPIVINLFADDESVLLDLAPKVAEAVGKVPGVAEMRSGVVAAGDSINVKIDRDRAALEGVDADAVSKQLSDLLNGNVATRLQKGDRLFDVRVTLPRVNKLTAIDLEKLELRATDGHRFPLKRVATFMPIVGEPEITREDLRRVVSVTGRSDRDLGSTIADVRKILDTGGLLPPGVRYTLGGLYEQQQQAFNGLLEVALAALALVFLLLLFMYESFRVAVAIMSTTLLAAAFVFIALWLTDTELNISSLMGMVMIVGNVTEVAIFYMSEFVSEASDTDIRDRLIAAGSQRMRAISMTTLAAILALLPLAIGWGQGSAMLQPLAIAIIAGLIAQLPLVLIVLPALLLLLGAIADRTHWRLNMRVFSCSLASIAVLAAAASFAAPTTQPDFHIGEPLAIGGAGGWDYVTVDPAAGRIYLPRSTHTMVVNEADGKVIADIPGQSRNHGVAIVPAVNRGFITDGEKGTVVIFDLKTNEVLGSVKAADDADGIIYDAATNKLFVSCGDANAVVAISPDVDPKSGKVDATIDVGGKPEFLAADGSGRLFVNVEDKDNVAVIDAKALKLITHWPVAPGGAPVGMSIDPKGGHLFVGCRKPQKMVVMSMTDGKVVADLPIGAGVDATAFDDGYAFASCRDGTLAVIGETSPGKFQVVTTVQTAMGSRTVGVDSKTHRLFLPAAEFGMPASKGGRPAVKEGSFHVLVIEPPAK